MTEVRVNLSMSRVKIMWVLLKLRLLKKGILSKIAVYLLNNDQVIIYLNFKFLFNHFN